MASSGEKYTTGNPTENDLSLKEESKRPLGKSVDGLEHQYQQELEESRAHCAELQKQNEMLQAKAAERDELEEKVKFLHQALEQRLAVQEQLQNQVRKLNEELKMIKVKECKRTELQKEYSEQLVTLNKELKDKQSANRQLHQELMKSHQQVDTLYQRNIVFRSQFDMEIMRRDLIIRQLQGTLNFISQNGWIGDKISQGACGIVHQGAIPVAVKQPLHMSRENVQLFLKEKEIGYACHHPNLVQMFDVTDNPLIVMERLEGNLREFLNCYFHHLKATHIKRLALDIANGLNHLHRQRPPILHRDLKPENILLKKKGDFYIAKIGDYGTLRIHCDKMTPNRGTFIYAAPEGQTQDKQSTKMDIYSYGLVLKEICTGIPPYCQVSVQIDPRFKRLIDACIQPDPTLRPTITEVITSLNQLHV